MITRNVVHDVTKGDGTPWVGARYRFRLNRGTYTGTEQVPRTIVDAYSDEDGVLTAPLFVNETGVIGTQWAVDDPGGETFTIVVPLSGDPLDVDGNDPTDLELGDARDLYTGPTEENYPDTIASLIEAVAVMVNNHIANVANPHNVTMAQLAAAALTVTSLTSTGSVLIGNSTTINVGGVAPRLSSHGTGGTAQSSVVRWSADGSGPTISGAKSRGAAVGTFGAVAAGDVLANFTGYGDDSTDLNTVGARMRFVVAASPAVSVDKIPTYIEWQVGDGVTASAFGKMWLTELGVFQVGNTQTNPTSGARVEIFANTLSTGAVVHRLRSTSSSNAWPTGEANAWAWYDGWCDDATSPGTSRRAGVSIHSENANGSAHGMAIWVGPTAGLARSLLLNSDLTADFAGAIKRAGTQVVNTRRTGWTTVPTGTLDRTTFVSDSVTLPNLAARVAALIVDLHAAAGHGLIGA